MRAIRAISVGLLEVVDDGFGAVGLEDLFDELEMQGMDLVDVLRFFGIESDIERDLIALLHDRAGARHHPAGVEKADSGNRAKVLFRAGNQLFGGIGVCGIGPENDDVTKHRQPNYRNVRERGKPS